MSDRIGQFSHLDRQGRASMVDVSGKDETVRTAVAMGRIRVSEEIFCAIKDQQVKKGDVFSVARIAGIQAAKRTWELIPLCHILMLSLVAVEFTMLEETLDVECRCTVRCKGKTGVEMEALTGVNVALLTIYDMCKAMGQQMVIHSVCLLEKDGGRSGHYEREDTL